MNLYLFTDTFPFGYGESFLEDEIPILAKYFDKITITPLWDVCNKRIRTVPSNCTVNKSVLRGRVIYNLTGFYLFRGLKYFLKDFFDNKVYKKQSRTKAWIRSFFLFNCIINNKNIRKIEKQITKNDICYFYWGVNFINLALIWNNKAKFISRFHATYDLWEENRGNYTPLRKAVIPFLQKAFFISEEGMKYFCQRYTGYNVAISRLGVTSHGISKKSDDGVLRVLSCSNVIPLKRVPMILRSLKLVSNNHKVIWTHIGDGVEFHKVKQLAEELETDNFHIKLLGQLEHSEVINYYKTNKIDLFINLSTSEGIPVSIMEAVSFNVPCIATDVGATRELVTNEVGLVLEKDVSEYDVSKAVQRVVKCQLTPQKIWYQKYNADTNYNTFAKLLTNI